MVFSWVYIITFVVIKIVSPGPAFYRAKRVGKGGRVFDCLKFRSMRVDSGKVHLTTLRNDNRVFGFGKFIRKTKIDEMPQMLNILAGDMTVVGPRPEDVVNADALYVGEYCHILDVKPGLTSLATLYDYTHGEKYDNETDYEKYFVPRKLRLELYYIYHASFWYDVLLVAKTGWMIMATMLGKETWAEPEELNEL